MQERWLIGPKAATALRLARGDRLRIVDAEGSQVADVVALSAADPTERLSQQRTRIHHWSARPTVGDVLLTNRDRGILRIVEDVVGVHDILFPPCSSDIYERLLDAGPRRGCLEHLGDALASLGFAADRVTDTFNAFMATGIEEDGSLQLDRAPSRAGDAVVLAAEMDCVVAVSACADDVTDCNGGRCTPIRVERLAASQRLASSGASPVDAAPRGS